LPGRLDVGEHVAAVDHGGARCGGDRSRSIRRARVDDHQFVDEGAEQGPHRPDDLADRRLFVERGQYHADCARTLGAHQL
jgi:hypothetical protein